VAGNWFGLLLLGDIEFEVPGSGEMPIDDRNASSLSYRTEIEKNEAVLVPGNVTYFSGLCW
jgi:hypothetical protein